MGTGLRSLPLPAFIRLSLPLLAGGRPDGRTN